MRTGIDPFIGYPPEVRVTERKLITDIPEAEREEFVRFLGDRAQCTRGGVIVFDARIYDEWKR